MKLKALAAAVALMSTATVANAAWNDGKNAVSGAASGNGELVLLVWDQVLEVSVVQDLGDSYLNFYDNSQNTAFQFDANLDALFASTFANSNAADIQWSVFANSAGSTLSSNPERSKNGFMVTVNDAEENPTVDRSIGSNFTGIQAKVEGVMSGALNTAMGGTVADNTAFYGDLANGLYAGAPEVYGSNILDTFPVNVGAASTESMYFWAFESTFAGGEDTKFAGKWSLDLAGNTLSYSAVPVPAAVWLLASGLLGLGAISRRRKA